MKALTKKRLACVWMVAAWMAAGGASGAEITLEQAETAVGNWAARGGAFGTFAGAPEVSGETFEDSDTGAKMHVVRVPGKGFAVTSADDGIEPIILFSDGDGEFVAEEGHPLWDLLRMDLAARAEELENADNAHHAVSRTGKSGNGTGGEKGTREVPSPQEHWAELLSSRKPGARAWHTNGLDVISDVRIPPLLKTAWSQNGMYSPARTNEDGRVVQAPCGCTATAWGQIMKYWKHPSTPVTPLTNQCLVFGTKQTLSMMGGVYEWDKMGNVHPSTDTEREAFSKVVYDIGVACGASFDIGGTGMWVNLYTITNVFGYSYAVTYWPEDSSTLETAVTTSLDANAPLLALLDGSNLGRGGHAVVFDGCGHDQGGFVIHVNFGWGGTETTGYNVWYKPPNLGEYTRIGSVTYIFPEGTGSVLSGRVTGPHGRPISSPTICLDTSGGTTIHQWKAGENGIYSHRAAAGTYLVRATAGLKVSETKSVALKNPDFHVVGNALQDLVIPDAETVAAISALPSPSPDDWSAAGGTCREDTTLTLNCATPNVRIYYTTDGASPIDRGVLYETPIPIRGPTTLRAVACAEGMECSEMLEQTWTWPSCDGFANARSLRGEKGWATFDNAGYTKESGEPIHSSKGYSGGASAWAKWVAPSNGDWTFWLEGIDSSLDTQLAVYTGSSVTGLVRIASNDDTPAGGTSSRVSIHATAGTEYMIAMDTYYGKWAPMKLHWEGGYVHSVRFKVEYDYPTRFVPQSGGRVEVGVESSTNWGLVEYTDSVTPVTREGGNGDVFACSVAANGTGRERTESVWLQAGNSERASLLLRQHSMDFVTTKEEALDSAWLENKRILLVRGRESNTPTQDTLFNSIPTESVRALVKAGYVLWYSNADRQRDADMYAVGVPTVAILDPLDMSSSVVATNGYQSADELLSLLQTSAAWDGLPRVRIETIGIEAMSATVMTKVRAWGAGADSATVILETASDAAFTEVQSARTLGNISQIWTVQEWQVAPDATNETSFCRLRVSSGDWDMVSEVFEFIPLPIALDNTTMAFVSEGAAFWRGQSAETHDGVDAVECASVRATGTTYWSESSLKTSVPGPGRLSFWWKGNGAYGWLTLYVDGSPRKGVSVTNRIWEEVSLDFAGTSEHEVEWGLQRYDSSNSYYNATGWVDQVTWTPGAIVTLDRQGGWNGAASVLAIHGELLAEITPPIRTGYTFGGYFTENDGKGTQYISASGEGSRIWEREGDATLHAKWTPNTYTATLDWQGGAGGAESVTATYGEIPPSVAVPALAGYDFIGYYTATNGGGVQYYNAEGEGLRAWFIATNATLHAHWLRKADVAWGYRVENGKAVVTNAVPASGKLTIPAELDGYPVESIGYGAFQNATNLLAVVIPDGVESLGSSAFYNCSALTSVTLPDGLKDIGNYAFYYCCGLGAVHIPGSVTNIGSGAFYCAYNLSSLVIPDSVTSLGNSAFAYCSGLKRLEVPGTWWGRDNVARSGVPSGCEVVYRGIDPLTVVTEALPAGMAGKGYQATLAATGGIAPYTWREAVGAHAETQEAGSYSETGTAKGWQADDSCWDLALPFAFPYFGHSYTNAKINSNGAISFGANRFTAYAYSEGTFNGAPIIAALWKDLSTADGGIFVTSGTDAVTVRWSGTYYNGVAVNFSATLHRSGKIVLSYGAGNAGGGTIGLSAGDGVTTVFSAKSNGGSMENADDIVFTPGEGLPPWLALSADGKLTGTPPEPGEYRVPVTVTDLKGVTAGREFTLAVSEPCQVTTFMGNGGTPTAQKTTNEVGGAYGTMPTPKWSGHIFLGWFTKAVGGSQVTAVDKVTEAAARTLYAHWTDQQVTTFLGNGGTPETQATTNTIYGKYAFPPTPTWGGHAFQGWYNALEGGKRVYTNSTVTLAAARTLYAHWTTARGFAITAIAVGADAGEEGGGAQAVPGEEQAKTVCRLRFEQSDGTEYEIQWTTSMDGEWESVERLTAETDGEVEVEIEVPGREEGFFRVVAFEGAGEAD